MKALGKGGILQLTFKILQKIGTGSRRKFFRLCRFLPHLPVFRLSPLQRATGRNIRAVRIRRFCARPARRPAVLRFPNSLPDLQFQLGADIPRQPFLTDLKPLKDTRRDQIDLDGPGNFQGIFLDVVVIPAVFVFPCTDPALLHIPSAQHPDQIEQRIALELLLPAEAVLLLTEKLIGVQGILRLILQIALHHVIGIIQIVENIGVPVLRAVCAVIETGDTFLQPGRERFAVLRRDQPIVPHADADVFLLLESAKELCELSVALVKAPRYDQNRSHLIISRARTRRARVSPCDSFRQSAFATQRRSCPLCRYADIFASFSAFFSSQSALYFCWISSATSHCSTKAGFLIQLTSIPIMSMISISFRGSHMMVSCE